MLLRKHHRPPLLIVATALVAALGGALLHGQTTVMNVAYCRTSSNDCSSCFVETYPTKGACSNPNLGCYVTKCNDSSLSIKVCIWDTTGLGPCSVTGSSGSAFCYVCKYFFCGCTDSGGNCTSKSPSNMATCNGGGTSACSNTMGWSTWDVWNPIPTCVETTGSGGQ